MKKVIVYDLAGADDRRFSPPCWYVKLALNLKGIDFRTQPTGYKEIAAIGNGQFKTLPVLQHDDIFVGDSWSIIEYLEATALHKPMFANRTRKAQAMYARAHIESLRPGIAPVIFLDIYRLVREEDKDYFRSSREQRIGCTLEQAASQRKQKLGQLQALMQPFDQILSSCKFLDGDAPGYPDIHLLGLLLWVHAVSDLPLSANCEQINPWLQRCLPHFSGDCAKAIAAMLPD